MRELENNSLDLNNFPEDYTRDGNKQVFEGSSSSSGCRKKKSDGKEECGKVYECRFCSLKFCKSQALGGHMNRHRQERETETLNKARQLVFGNDTVAAHPALPHHHLACQSIPGGYHSATNVADPPLTFRSSMCLPPPPPPPSRFFSASSSSSIVQQPPPYLYSSPPRLVAYPSHYNSNQHATAGDNYMMGHVFGRSSSSHFGTLESNYTCIGAPIGEGFNAPGRGGRDRSPQGQKEGLNWVSRLDPPLINRFQDGF